MPCAGHTKASNAIPRWNAARHRATRVAAQLAQSVAQVLDKMVKPKPAMRSVKALLGVGHVSKVASRRFQRFLLAHARFPHPVRFPAEIRLKLFGKVAWRSFAPSEHIAIPLPLAAPARG
jgi:hypothetical protein